MATNYPLQVTIGASVAASLGNAIKEAQNGIGSLGKSLDAMSGKKANIERLTKLKEQAAEAGKAWRDAQNQVRNLQAQKADGSYTSKGLESSKARVSGLQERLAVPDLSDKAKAKLQAQLDKANASLASNQAKVDAKFASELERAAQVAAMAKDKFTQTKSSSDALAQSLQAAGVNTKKLSDESTKLGATLDALKQKTESLAKAQSAQSQNLESRKAYREQAMDVVALGASLYGVMKPAIEFESVMADIGKVVNFDSNDEFKQMGNDILAMSTKIPMAAQGLGDIMAAAGQAGIAKEELRQFTQDAAKMGVAFDISGKEAGAAMTGLRSIFHLSQTDVVSLGDAFNHLSNNMDAKARDMLNISNRAGSMAAMFGLTGQQLGALGATFLALKSPPEVAATGINAMMLKLATADKQNKKFQEGLFAVGMSAEVMKKMIAEDAQGALLTFLKAVKKTPDVMGTLSDLFGLEYSDDIAKLVNGLDTYEKSLQLIGDKSQYAGSMEKEYQTRSATTANNIQLLQNQMTRLGVVIGNALLPALNSVIGAFMPVIESLASLAERFPMVTQLVVGGVAALTAYKIATIGLGYAWTFIKAPFLAATVAFSKARLGLAVLQAQTIATTGSAGVFATAWTAVKLATTSIAAPLASAGTAFRLLAASVWASTTALLANPITWIVVGIGAAVAGVVMVIRKYLDPITAYIGGVFDGIKAVMQPAIDALTAAFAPLAPVGNALRATFDWIGDGISKVVNWFSQLLTPVTLTTDEFNNISASGKSVGEVIGGVLYGAFTLLTFPIKAVGLAIGLLMDGFNAIANFSPLEKITAAWQPVADYFTGLFDGIKNTVGNAMGWISDKLSWVSDKAQAVKGFFSSDDSKQSKPSPVGEALPKANSVGEVMCNSGIAFKQAPVAALAVPTPQSVVRNQSATSSQNITLNPTITIQGSIDPQATAAIVDARVRAMLKDAQRSHSGMLFD